MLYNQQIHRNIKPLPLQVIQVVLLIMTLEKVYDPIGTYLQVVAIILQTELLGVVILQQHGLMVMHKMLMQLRQVQPFS